MIVVTGGAGFIGSNLVHALARDDPVLAVDDLRDGSKFENLVGSAVDDYLDKDDFLARVRGGGALPAITALVHQGACSDTMERDGRYVMSVNYEFSKTLLEFCLARRVPLVYASSAAVYGAGPAFAEAPGNERPLNVYGWSKLMFDGYVRRRLPAADSQVVGLRYFNVYGPRERHKGRMASVAFHLHSQLLEGDAVRLFVGSGGYGDGEQRRDFVHVDDVVAVVRWFLERPDRSGVFNVGTGRAQTFNEVASAVIGWHGRGRIEYVPFPDGLEARYQSFTEADVGALRGAGYEGEFLDVAAGVARYLDALDAPRRAR